MLDDKTSLDVFFVDILEKLHIFALNSMMNCVMFAVECLELLDKDILYPVKRAYIFAVPKFGSSVVGGLKKNWG